MGRLAHLKSTLTTAVTKTKTIVFAITMIGSLTALPLARAAAVSPSVPAAKISFTFDDGLASARTLAAPALAEYGYTGTSYIISDCIGMTTAPNTCRADTASQYMTAAQIKELQTTYGWEIGAHTKTHALLATSDPVDQPNVLSSDEVMVELTQSRDAIAAITGKVPTAYASPYGDWLPPVLGQIASIYSSHRGFADTIDQDADGIIEHGNTFPYNDYLLYDVPVQVGVDIARVKSYIDQSIANNQWLVLTFHEIRNGDASTDPESYQLNVSVLKEIAAYAKSKNMAGVNITDGLAKGPNLLANPSFDTVLSSDVTNSTVWSTDGPSNITTDNNSNGSYGTPTNSVHLTSASANTELFSPRVAIDATKKYTIKNYLRIEQITAGSSVSFYIDEYDAAGVWKATQYNRAEISVWTENLNLLYSPAAGTAFARLQVVVAGPGVSAYLDNVSWFVQDPNATSAVLKAGDVNGDSKIDALDLSLIAKNWNKTGVTRAQGDLNGDGAVNALDLSILAKNWGK